MSRKVRSYPKEFKEEAVNLAIKSPSISKIAAELGMPVGTLHTWIKQLKGKSVQPTAEDAGPNITALIEENRRLYRELSIVREEKEILKKAAAYFAVNQK